MSHAVAGGLSPAQLEAFEREGYLLLETAGAAH